MNANRSKHLRSVITELVDMSGEDLSARAVNEIAKKCSARSFVLRGILLE